MQNQALNRYLQSRIGIVFSVSAAIFLWWRFLSFSALLLISSDWHDRALMARYQSPLPFVLELMAVAVLFYQSFRSLLRAINYSNYNLLRFHSWLNFFFTFRPLLRLLGALMALIVLLATVVTPDGAIQPLTVAGLRELSQQSPVLPVALFGFLLLSVCLADVLISAIHSFGIAGSQKSRQYCQRIVFISCGLFFLINAAAVLNLIFPRIAT